MRHRKLGRRLDMNSSQRKALFRNMATSLMLHGQIRTTEARAKELRRFAERLITIGKRAPSEAELAAAAGDAVPRVRADRVAAIRRLAEYLQDEVAIKRVMGEYAERFRTRPGGYTRIVKLARRRPGDTAPMAIVQLVERYEPASAAAGGSAVGSAQVDSAPVDSASGEAEVAPETAPEAPAEGEPEKPETQG